ncbi:hypothetical protein PHJA_002361900 [Phtheirospermum japonicum]|uniref:Uncharacterized protein n=1 Tax=Phtheirospermum japonicum TaxID=374723 RepID=A0A830CT34_9LAMI|nr:hypothetical protein PHJA_002361900 [Phtheirospermum japonicum]
MNPGRHSQKASGSNRGGSGRSSNTGAVEQKYSPLALGFWPKPQDLLKLGFFFPMYTYKSTPLLSVDFSRAEAVRLFLPPFPSSSSPT